MRSVRPWSPATFIVLAVVAVLALLWGPSSALRSVLGTGRPAAAGGLLGLDAAFSVEPTVTVSIGSPRPGAYVGPLVTVEATALADAGLARVFSRADGVLIQQTDVPFAATAWRYQAAWDSTGRGEGPAVIQVVAQDIAGRAATAAVSVMVDHLPPRIGYAPRTALWAFSPNGDRRRDSLDVRVVGSEPILVRAKLFKGESWRWLVDTKSPRRSVRIVWDGRWPRGASKAFVPDGRYPLVLSMRDRAGNSVDKTVMVLVDRAGPTAAWAGAARTSFWPAKRQKARAALVARDATGPLVITTRVVNAARATVRKTVIVTSRGGRTSVSWDGRYANRRVVWPGEYRWTVEVADAAGNSTRLPARRVQVHAVRRPVLVSRVATKKKLVALTFDDIYKAGPTRSILDTLDLYGVKATFFVVGQAAAVNRSILRDIVARGHVLGNHSINHPVMPGISPTAQRAQILGCDRTVRAVTGRSTSPWYRPPYGARNGATDISAAQAEHPFVFLWDIDTLDWSSPGVAKITSTALKARRGSIILMHGGPPQTPRALPAIIRGLKARGYKMVTLPELLWAGGYR